MNTVEFGISDIEEHAYDFLIGGSSDDIITFHGHIDAEQYKMDGGLTLSIEPVEGEGGVEVRMDYDGIWKPRIGLLEQVDSMDGRPIPMNWVVQIRSDLEKCEYSTYAHLNIPESFTITGDVNPDFFNVHESTDTFQMWRDQKDEL